MSAPRLCLLLAATLCLASCGGGQDAQDDARSSSGEVLDGTISDAMLPVDTVRSQPPLLRPEPAPSASDNGDQATDEAGASDADPAEESVDAPSEPADETESEEGA